MDIPLSQLKHQLEEMLLDLQQLVTALQRLRDLLPEHSEKRVTVLTLLGRLNDANKKSLRGTLDNIALQTEYNAIRADLSDFVQGLEEVDFDATATANTAGAKGPAAKQGNVLYRIPHTMPMGQETECVVRIALDEDAIVEEITLDNQVVLKNLSRISDLMQVELGDPARQPVFSIRSTSPAQQLITDEGYTQWYFYVEPLRDGVHPLEVKVSVLELALNQVHRKELVFRETIQIITEGPAAESEESVPQQPAGFKKAGEALAFAGAPTDTGDIGPNAGKGAVEFIPKEPAFESTESGNVMEAPPKRSSNNSLRTVALFLAFIVLGSSATWALTPAETRDWWVASIIQDDTNAYATYIEKHPESPYVEKALFFKAERSQRLDDLRVYQDKYPRGKYLAQVATRIDTLEFKALNRILQQPTPTNIQQFAATFPESEQLQAVKQAAENRAENRQELVAAVEDAYITTARARPTAKKVTDYLRDFPQHERLDEVTAAAATKPEVMAKVQPALEAAYLKKMEANPTPAKADEFLQQFPQPVNRERFEEVLAKKPVLKRDAINKMNKLEALRNARKLENQ